MDTGDKVVCIDNDGNTANLTIGKEYEVLEYPHYQLSDTIYIVNDKGQVGGYYKKRFKKQ